MQLLGKMYALGGHNGLSIFDSVEEYDTQTECWAETVPMLSKRCRLGVGCMHLNHREQKSTNYPNYQVATLGGKIYACGGYDGSSFLRSVECFDPVTSK